VTSDVDREASTSMVIMDREELLDAIRTMLQTLENLLSKVIKWTMNI